MVPQSPFRNRNLESKPDSGRYMASRIPDFWSSGLGGQSGQEVVRVAGIGRRAAKVLRKSLGSRRFWKSLGSRRFWGGLGRRAAKLPPQSNPKPQSTHKNTVKTQKYYGPKPFKNTKHTRKHSQIINKMVSGRNTSPKEIRP